MSHVATIEIEIKDLEALKLAAQECGLEFREGQKTYRWWGRSVGDYPLPEGFSSGDLGVCDHALSVTGSPTHDGSAGNSGRLPYEVGVVRRRDGKPGYVLLWDFFCKGFGLQDSIGANGQKLVQRYAVNVAKKQAVKQGYACREAMREDGSIALEMTRRPGR